ncbi:hypothetical protein P692DRAFT_201720309 [Suillus brevipes Sb2]|nr:hypothetical protein P692DRAFT_201720309 [Suillus brevipes Sb2]
MARDHVRHVNLSDVQLAALKAAQDILDNAGLSPLDLNTNLPPSRDASPAAPSTSVQQPASPEVIAARYRPPPARLFTTDEVARGCNKINRETSVDAIIEHPLSAIVEYPQTGSAPGLAVAHVFHIDPSPNLFIHPKSNLQYSLGDSHNGRQNAQCFLLKDPFGKSVLCSKLRTSCKGLKLCSARPDDCLTHDYVDRHSLNHTSPLSHSDSPQTEAKKEVFLKTLNFFCAIKDKGCSLSSESNLDDSTNELLMYHESESTDMDSESEFDIDALSSRRERKRKTCKGNLVMLIDQFNQPFIQCEYFSTAQRAHLVLRNLQEFDTPYLHALLENDQPNIFQFEEYARAHGYAYWHRKSDGVLCQGVLRKWNHKCTTTYDIYVPNDLFDCPRVLIVSRNPHSHALPLPVKTPPAIVKCFSSLLLRLEWKLADATPRQLVLDSGFMQELRCVLGWSPTADFDPHLEDLHPSLGNLDHVRWLINVMCLDRFPNGTGFDGAKLLADEQKKLPLERRYIHCAETHCLPNVDSGLRLVICMTSRMSQHLLSSKRLSIDTSFKRVRGWQEFEIESWDDDHMRSVVSARAMTSSQTAEAHLILFRRIFEIATQDTGIPVAFYHIHGFGIESIIADGHRGQAKGLGMYCVEVSQGQSQYCIREPHRRICDLNPYDHLCRFYRLCITHFQRNILALRGQVSKNVYDVMLSLASAEAHPNIRTTLSIIRQGGKRREDKESSKFALPAIYRPMSFIPIAIWKASPTITNGNEQAHRNINRGRINLTLLAGIMRGYEYDVRATSSIDLHIIHGINTRDNKSTHLHRAKHAVSRQSKLELKVLHAILTKPIV